MTDAPTLYITRGLPASGKTTFAEKWVAEDPTHRHRVNRDDLRAMLNGSHFEKGVTEKAVIRARDALMTALLKLGISVISDDTNLPQRTARDLRDLAVRNGATFDIIDFTHVSLRECLDREMERGKLGDPAEGQTVIKDMHQRFLAGKTLPLPWPDPHDRDGAPSEDTWVPYEPCPDKPKAVVVDIDGTVALMAGRDPFDESLVHLDRPNQRVIDAVLAHASGWNATILFRSGRTDGCFSATYEWLKEHATADHIPWNLRMRKKGDTRKDNLVKHEMLDELRGEWDIIGVYDDRNQVVEMWRACGLTVFQVAEGKF